MHISALSPCDLAAQLIEKQIEQGKLMQGNSFYAEQTIMEAANQTWQAAGIRGGWNIGEAAEQRVGRAGAGRPSAVAAPAAAGPGPAAPEKGEVSGLRGGRLGGARRHLEVGVVCEEALQGSDRLAKVRVHLGQRPQPLGQLPLVAVILHVQPIT